ncbi:MAG: PadR family transcriptional regulator [Erythrobacter sp.]
MDGDSLGDENWEGSFAGFAKPKRRRTRMFASGELRLALLHLIGQQSRHGYDLIKAIAALTGGTYAPSPGAIYPTLALMVDEGVIKETPSNGMRKSFEIAQEGVAELDVRNSEAKELLVKLASYGERNSHTAPPELLRSMGKLGNVLKHRAETSDLKSNALQMAVDMIDDAAKRIERF